MNYRHTNAIHLLLYFYYSILLKLIISGQMVINIEDINDNAPEFIYSDSVFGEFISKGV